MARRRYKPSGFYWSPTRLSKRVSPTDIQQSISIHRPIIDKLRLNYFLRENEKYSALDIPEIARDSFPTAKNSFPEITLIGLRERITNHDRKPGIKIRNLVIPTNYKIAFNDMEETLECIDEIERMISKTTSQAFGFIKNNQILIPRSMADKARLENPSYVLALDDKIEIYNRDDGFNVSAYYIPQPEPGEPSFEEQIHEIKKNLNQ